MTTTLPIRMETDTQDRFRSIFYRLKSADQKVTQGEVFEMALDALTDKLDGKVVAKP